MSDDSLPMLSVYTFTLGRPFYLNKFLRSVQSAFASYAGRIEHHLCCQGVELEPESLAIVSNCDLDHVRYQVHNWPENIGTPAGVNRIVPQLEGDLIVKMDDDSLICSSDFFNHVATVARLKPRSVFSPYPVGLITFAGGPKPLSHHVEYSAETDTYYTFRKVEHVGGFCRIAPGPVVREWKLTPGKTVHVRNEDQQYSRLCREHGIDMYYLENALIVEHQESTLGQQVRYAEYFSERPATKPGRLPFLRKGLRALRRSLRIRG